MIINKALVDPTALAMIGLVALLLFKTKVPLSAAAPSIVPVIVFAVVLRTLIDPPSPMLKDPAVAFFAKVIPPLVPA